MGFLRKAACTIGILCFGLISFCGKASAEGFSENLLKNPTIEAGKEGKPEGWSFHGKTGPRTEDELNRLYDSGYPPFETGRGSGEWSEESFSGRRCLKLIPDYPPLSPKRQWYGTGGLDGYWISDPIPCEPGSFYLAGGWIRLSVPRSDTLSYGFLQVWFYDKNDRRIRGMLKWDKHRPLLNPADFERWGFYPTPAYQAPPNASAMRLVFLTEFNAGRGGFGNLWADNLAVWQVPEDVRLFCLGPNEIIYQEWWQGVKRALPPQLPPPRSESDCGSVWLLSDSQAPGEIFFDKDKPLELEAVLYNLLSTPQRVTLKYIAESWLGQRISRGKEENITLEPYAEKRVKVELPAVGSYGGYTLRMRVYEKDRVITEGLGRFGVIPEPKREKPAAARSPWIAYADIGGGGLSRWATKPQLEELAFLINLVGMKWAWWNLYDPTREGYADMQEFRKEQFLPVYEFWHGRCGMEYCGTIGHTERAGVTTEEYKNAVRRLVKGLKDKIHVWSCLGVEQANDRSPFRRIPTEDYDRQMKAAYEAVKEADPTAVVLTGAIATDIQANTLKRFYEGTVGHSFDGVILNSYGGVIPTVRGNIEMMNSHGDTKKPVWIRETAEHEAPVSGSQRLSGERSGSGALVRASVQLLSDFSPRFEKISWFVLYTPQGGRHSMLTPSLQPRPQYLAYVVMTDRLGKATPWRKIEYPNALCYLWRDGERLVGVAWAKAGQQQITLKVDVPEVRITDLMGNEQRVATPGGILNLSLTELPLYLEGAKAMEKFKDIALSMSYGMRKRTEPLSVEVTLRSGSGKAYAGQVELNASAGWKPQPAKTGFRLGGAGRKEVIFKLSAPADFDSARRYDFSARATTAEGISVSTSASLNFARSFHAARPPALDGSTRGWEGAEPLLLDKKWQVRECALATQFGVTEALWKGPEDVSARAYTMWDEDYFYLMVTVTDDFFAPWKERSFAGFMGDAIEFAFQPDNELTPSASQFEYELFLAPAGRLLPGGKPSGDYNWSPFALPGKTLCWRHLPYPNVEMTGWRVHVAETGRRGDCVYQAAIPWPDIGSREVKAGKVLSFSLSVNDNDAQRKDVFPQGRRWIHWFAGISEKKDPARYGDLVLVE